MSEHFRMYIPNAQSAIFREHHTALFLLLSYAVENVHWYLEPSELGLHQGDCILGSPKKAGISPKQYALAIQKGVQFGLWEIVYNKKNAGLSKGQKRTINGTINSIVVNIKDPMFWDLNLQKEDKQKDKQRTNKGQTPPIYNKEPKELKQINNNNVVADFISSLSLSDSEKDSLIRDNPSIERMKLAWEDSQKDTIQTTLIQYLRWHIKSKTPPKIEKKITLKQKLNQHFVNGELYNGAECFFTEETIGFVRGFKEKKVKIDDKSAHTQFKEILNLFEIESNIFKD